MFDLRTRQDLNRGFSEAFGRGIDLALTPVVCAGIGWLVDRVAGTGPVFLVVFAVVGAIGTFVKIKLGYDRDMTAFDDSAATRPRAVAPLPVSTAKKAES